MPNPFISLNNFRHHRRHRHQEKEESTALNPKAPHSSPLKRSSLCKRRAHRYSKRGLDKFTALLARLHEKRRIYSEMGPNHPNNRNADMKLNPEKTGSEKSRIKTGVLSERSENVNKWRRPGYYLLVVIIFVLLFLALLGKSAAIMSTCIGWYILPILKGEDPAVRCKNIESTLQPWRRSADKDEIISSLSYHRYQKLEKH